MSTSKETVERLTYPRLTYRVWPDAATLVGVGRSTAYTEAKKGYFAGVPVMKIGRQYFVSKAALDSVLSGEEPLDPA